MLAFQIRMRSRQLTQNNPLQEHFHNLFSVILDTHTLCAECFQFNTIQYAARTIYTSKTRNFQRCSWEYTELWVMPGGSPRPVFYHCKGVSRSCLHTRIKTKKASTFGSACSFPIYFYLSTLPELFRVRSILEAICKHILLKLRT